MRFEPLISGRTTVDEAAADPQGADCGYPASAVARGRDGSEHIPPTR
jgi:hypothetical protein